MLGRIVTHPEFISDQRGFTLTELVTVLSILTILAFVAVGVSLSSLPRYQLKTQTRDLVSDMRLARQRAATENWQYALRFTSETAYEVVRGDQPLLRSSELILPVVTRDIHGAMGRWSVHWVVPRKAPVFQPDGLITSWVSDDQIYSPDPPDPVILSNSRNEGKTVSLSRFGRIRVE